MKGSKTETPWTVGIPRALTTFSYMPLWRDFFARLGARVVSSGATGERTIARGNAMVGADFCYPVKLFHGHAAALAERDDLDLIFLPRFVREGAAVEGPDAHFCVYTQGAPSLALSALEPADRPEAGPTFWTPTIDLRSGPAGAARTLARDLERLRGIHGPSVRRAFTGAMEAFYALGEKAREIGRRAIDEIERTGGTGIVVVGRPYTTGDDKVNQKLPRKVAEYGCTVIPMECLPVAPGDKDPDDLLYTEDPLWFMYWRYGREITEALRFIAGHPRLHALVLTSFNCGPDSFVLSYARRIMGGKPMLTLQMDEHSADAGYVTRLEAFLDVIAERSDVAPRVRFPRPSRALAPMRGKRLWIPRIHPVVPELLAAILRSVDIDARVLPLESRESHQAGLRVTRGSECMPMALTIGALLAALDGEGTAPEKTAYLMFRSNGPCLMGQYLPVQRMILDREGYGDVEIFSPASTRDLDRVDRSLATRIWDALIVGDLLVKLACKVRPYEVGPGETDRVLEAGLERLCHTLECRLPLRDAVARVAGDFADIRVRRERRPLVGIVGDFYVRFNEYSNEDVIRAVERHGGEVWLSPMIESFFYFNRDPRPGGGKGLFSTIKDSLAARLELAVLQARERLWYRRVPFLEDRLEPGVRRVEAEAGAHLSPQARSEAILNIGRAILFARDGADLVAHCSPFGCMPGNLSAAFFQQIQKETGVPIVNLIYDGHGDQNRLLGTYMANLG